MIIANSHTDVLSTGSSVRHHSLALIEGEWIDGCLIGRLLIARQSEIK